MTLTCFFSYFLINDLVKNPLAAFAGATLFTCAYVNGHAASYPYGLGFSFLGAGQTNLIAVQWLPLYFFYLHRLIYFPKQRVRYTALSIMCLLLMSLTDWQFVLYAVIVTVFLFVFILFTKRSWLEKGFVFLRLSIVGIGWVALAFVPLLLPMIQESSKSPWLNVSDQSLYHSLDLVDYLWPGMVNPSYLAIAIMLFGFIYAWKQKINRESITFWAISGGFAAILTLGPKLIISRNITDFQMPYSLLYKLPLLNVGRDPGRFQTIYLIAFSILFAFGLRFLIERNFFLAALSRLSVYRSRLAIGGVIVSILSITIFGFVAESGKVKVLPYDVPAFYEQLSKDTDQYAILELPLFNYAGRGDMASVEENYQAYQAVYNKWRVSGRYSRDHHLSNPDIFAKRETYIRDFYYLGSDQEKLYRPGKDIIPDINFNRVAMPLLNYWKIRYIVVWKDSISDPSLLENYRKMITEALGSNPTPVYQDERMEAYRVPESQPLAEKLVLDIGSGWYDREIDKNGSFRWSDPTSEVPSELYVNNLTPDSVRVKLNAKLFNSVPAGKKQARTINVSINGYLAATYQFGEYGEAKDIEVDLTLPTGFNVITLSSPEPSLKQNDTTLDNRNFTFGASNVKINIVNN